MSGAPTWTHVFVDVPREQWSRSVAFWCAAAGDRAAETRRHVYCLTERDPATGDVRGR